MQYNVIVIGAGPGGYVAAIRCAQLGMKTAIIEKESLGGTCLNVGCIPSKALLDSTEHVYKAKKEFAEHGINIGEVKVDFKQMVKRKREVVKQTVGGVEFLMKKNKIDVFNGLGSFKDKNTITVTKKDGSTEDITSDKVIIATGSSVGSLPFIKIDGKRIISSTEALELDNIPKSMIVIGGGVIGMEMGSVYGRLGTEVTVIEYAPSIIPSMDLDCGKELMKTMKKMGVKFHLNTGATEVKSTAKSVTVKAKNHKKDTEIEIKADYCLVSVGRIPHTEGLGLENIGIELDERNRIPVDEHLQTKIPGIYAIGDVIRGAMLAHKAEEEGAFVAEVMNGEQPHINYKLIPGVVYTWPEVAGVGWTEQELKKEGKAYKVGKFPFRASGRARASMDIDGFIKVIADKETDEILGFHMVGPRIADLIIEGVVAMEYRASAEDIARMSHPHPTYSEAVKEACLAATDNRAIHV